VVITDLSLAFTTTNSKSPVLGQFLTVVFVLKAVSLMEENPQFTCSNSSQWFDSKGLSSRYRTTAAADTAADTEQQQQIQNNSSRYSKGLSSRYKSTIAPEFTRGCLKGMQASPTEGGDDAGTRTAHSQLRTSACTHPRTCAHLRACVPV